MAASPASCDKYHVKFEYIWPQQARSFWRDSLQLAADIQTLHDGTLVDHAPWRRSFGDYARSPTLQKQHYVNAVYSFDLVVPSDKVIIKWELVRERSVLVTPSGSLSHT